MLKSRNIKRLLRKTKAKLVSAFQKVIPISHKNGATEDDLVIIHPNGAFFRNFISVADIPDDFSFVGTPISAYDGHHQHRLPTQRLASPNYVQHYDPNEDLFWPEPVSPVRPAPSSARSVMSSLLAGLPSPPPLRRRGGLGNLRYNNEGRQSTAVSSISSLSFADASGTENGQDQHAGANLPSPPFESGWTMRFHSITEQRAQSSGTPGTSHPRGQLPNSDSGLNHRPRPQQSVSEPLNTSFFSTPPGREIGTSQASSSLGSPGPTIASSQRSSPFNGPFGVSQQSVIDRPRNPMATTFALGGDTLADPFSEQQPLLSSTSAPATQNDHILWSELTDSSDSRESPVYLGNGRYRLHDGTIHTIGLGESASRAQQQDAETTSTNNAESTEESDDSQTPEELVNGAMLRLAAAFHDVEGVSFVPRDVTQGLRAAGNTVATAMEVLLDDIETYARGAEQLRQRLDARNDDLAEANAIIRQQRDQIQRLRQPEVFGESSTPPTYSPDPATGHSSVMRTSGNDTAEESTLLHIEVERPSEADSLDGQAASDESESPNWRPISIDGIAGSAPPSYHNTPLEQTEFEEHSTPADNSSSDPPSSESRQTDNIHLRRTPHLRRRSV